jgi:hypothetical protein
LVIGALEECSETYLASLFERINPYAIQVKHASTVGFSHSLLTARLPHRLLDDSSELYLQVSTIDVSEMVLSSRCLPELAVLIGEVVDSLELVCYGVFLMYYRNVQVLPERIMQCLSILIYASSVRELKEGTLSSSYGCVDLNLGSP